MKKRSGRESETGGRKELADEMQVALQASERRLSAAVEASGAGVFELKLPFDGKLYVNRRLAEIVEYQEPESENATELAEWVEKRLDSEHRDELRTAFHEIGAGKRGGYTGDVRFRSRQRGWRWLRIWAKAAPLAGSAGDERLVGVIMDVSAEKERSLEAERRARQLRALAGELYNVEERERRQLAAELHDNLAQLVVATKMKLGLISPSHPENLEQHVREALQLLDRTDESVRSLTFSLSPPVLDELGLVPALRWLAKDMQKQFNLSVEVSHKEEDIGAVDPRIRFMLFRSIRELLINTAKHGDTKRARVVVAKEGGTIRALVEDEGRGFDRKTLPAEGSKGFGLFSIQERVESIGGKMEIWSAPSKGTRITIIVPRAEGFLDGRRIRSEAPSALASTLTVTSIQADRIRVLLADDHELVRSALGRLLDAQSDVEVVGEACDGESALELTGLLNPDVVLMDVTMAGIGGIEATRRIAKEFPETRVVGLSMHESADVASAMQSAGAVDYLRKNSPTHLLLDAIRKAGLKGRPASGSHAAPEG